MASFLEKTGVDLRDGRAIINKRFMLNDLYVFNPHVPGKRTFQVTGFARDTARTKTFKDQAGKVISVEGYFLSKYNVKLAHPNAPLLMGKGKTDLLPIEVAMIDSNQPVPKHRMTQPENAKMITLTAINPAIQKLEVKSFVGAIGLDKLQLEQDGIQMIKNGSDIVPLTVKGRILQNPEIVYAEKNTTVPGDDGLWNLPKKFLRCGTCTKWGLVKNGTQADVNVMRGFQNNFVEMCRKNGMNIPDKPDLIGSVGAGGMEPFFLDAKKKGVEFLVFVTDAQILNQGWFLFSLFVYSLK